MKRNREGRRNYDPEEIDWSEGLPSPEHLNNPDEESEVRHYIGTPEFKINERRQTKRYYRKILY